MTSYIHVYLHWVDTCLCVGRITQGQNNQTDALDCVFTEDSSWHPTYHYICWLALRLSEWDVIGWLLRVLDLSSVLRNLMTSNHLNRLFLDCWQLLTNPSKCLRPRTTLTLKTRKQVCFTHGKKKREGGGGMEQTSRSPCTNHRRTNE